MRTLGTKRTFIEPNANFFFDVALGNVPSFTRSALGGNNPGLSADNEEGVNNIRLETGTGSLYPYPTANVTAFVSSSSASDTGTIAVLGLDDTHTKVTRLATLNGQTPVALSGDIFRIEQMFIITATKAVGNIYLSTDDTDITAGVPNTLSNVLGKIDSGGKLFSAAALTVPLNQKAYLFALEPNTSKAGDVDITLRFRSNATDDFAPAPPFQVFQSSTTLTDRMGLVLVEKGEIDITATSPTVGSKVTVGFLIIFVDV